MTRRVHLVRHGEARSEEQDPARPLTDRGIAEVRQVIRLATPKGPVPVRRILHSGKTRARQTAELWGEALGVEVREAAGLAPSDDPSIWTEQLEDATDDLMLVGHLPHLAELAGRLLGGDTEPVVTWFPSGGLVVLERNDAGWRVQLVLSPSAE